MRLLTTLLLAALLLIPAAAHAQQADILTGRIFGPDKKPIADAQVEVLSLETEISRSVVTSANGRYTIIFPDGGGRYVMRVSYIGMAEALRLISRDGGEELLVNDIELSTSAISLNAIEVRAQLPPPGRGQSGEQSQTLTLESLTRLPLQNLDPESVALLASGVVQTMTDSLTGRARFSVGGMSDELNQFTLDGSIIGQGMSGFGAPEEGIRRMQVTTSTFDVSRGGFAGGQVQSQSARGNNRAAGSLSYGLDDAALQLRATATTNATTRHNIGGSYGGPIKQNKLFYNASFQLTRNVQHRFALAANDPLAAQRSGVAVDSITRFLSILDNRFSMPTIGQTGAYNQFSDDIRLQSRVDWNVLQKPNHAQTLTLRLNVNLNKQDSTRINALDLSQHGGDSDRNNRLAGLTLTSRLGTRWSNTLNASYSETWSDALPYVEMPEGQVRVTSVFEDGTRGTRNLVFGGNRNMPTEAYNRDIQLTNEVSYLMPVGNTQIHRLKGGASLQRLRDLTRSTDNLFGTFTYSSLADFEANDPDRYERSLSEREARTGRFLAGLWAGDTWRVIAPLEITYGVRWDYSRYDQQPAYNPVVDSVFGRRTDEMPVVGAFSPRLGFNLRLGPARPSTNQGGQIAGGGGGGGITGGGITGGGGGGGGGGGAGGFGGGGFGGGGQAGGFSGSRQKTLTGGIGVFAGRAPTQIFSTALRQTGLPDAEQRLVCIGSTVPFADWDRFRGEPGAVPTTCADGGTGSSTLSTRAPTVTVIAPDQALPSSLRAELSYRAPLPFNLEGSVRYTYSYGYGLWGYKDLNLNETKTFQLNGEDRPFFGENTAIVTRSGSVSMTSSRINRSFANVFEVRADRHSTAHQVALQLSGRVTPQMNLNLNYTLGRTRDDGSGSFSQVPIATNPNEPEWAVASQDRMHTMNLTLSRALTPWLELSTTARMSSGMPFTPIVNRDINGDGARNDRAFIFDPAAASDTAVANGMTRLLEDQPGRVRGCLEKQLGTIATRNSCRDSWTQALDLRANIRPNLPGVQRRLTMSGDIRNVLTGLDVALHGKDNVKGWGEGQRSETALLNVRSFDRTTNTFRYEVNEAFGQARRGPESSRNAFSVTFTARLAIGGQPNQTNRGFGQNPVIAGGGGATNTYGPFTAVVRAQNPSTNIDSAMAVAFVNPLKRLVSHPDSFGLNAQQVELAQELADSVDAQHQRRRDAVRPVIEDMIAQRRIVAAQFAAAQRSGGQQTARPDSAGGQRPPQAQPDSAAAQRPAPARPDSAGAQRPRPDSAGRTTQGQRPPAQTGGQTGQTGQTGGRTGQTGQTGQRPGGQTPQPPAMPQLLRQYQLEIRPHLDGGQREVREALRQLQKEMTTEQWAKLPRDIRDAANEPRQTGQPGQTPPRPPGGRSP